MGEGDQGGCSPLAWLRRKLREGWDKSIITTMKVTLSMGEFCFLLVVLVLVLEISPSDIPRVCPSGTQEACSGRLQEHNATLEFDDIVTSCGAMRVQCWRGSVKTLLYQNGKPPDNVNNVDFSALGVDEAALGQQTMGRIEYCLCLLTLNGTKKLPDSPSAWRKETGLFCDTLDDYGGLLSPAGFVIGTVLILCKSALDDLGDDAHLIISSSFMFWTCLFASIWFLWNLFLVYSLRAYGNSGNELNCELPEAQMYFYVFYIAVLSMLAAAMFAAFLIIFVLGCLIPTEGKKMPSWRNKNYSADNKTADNKSDNENNELKGEPLY